MRKNYCVYFLLAILFTACRKNEIKLPVYEEQFFNKNISLKAGEATESTERFTLVNPSGPDDERWIDRSISELKKLKSRKNFSDRIYKGLGQPAWNQSHIITGADSVKSVMTPIYKNKEVSGIIFSFYTSKGFKSRILP